MINNQSYFMTPRFQLLRIVLLFFDISHPIADCETQTARNQVFTYI
ncbi:MAG: hypothetical protein JWP94_910 [Mucilaginibacter sp.]|nr:hypothetical protein [Mucilaginibacter sp.]